MGRWRAQLNCVSSRDALCRLTAQFYRQSVLDARCGSGERFLVGFEDNILFALILPC
jgi:hypothetical protein